LNKFQKLVNGYHDHGHSWWKSLFYALRMVYKRRQLDHYSTISSVRAKNFLFLKTIVGGTVQLIPFRVKSGPKPVLEYAYFDGVRKDHFFNLLSGPNRDFNGFMDVLFLFAQEIRYKYVNQPEITTRTAISKHHSDELEKKILSITQPYE
jgi:hypothetical protein